MSTSVTAQSEALDDGVLLRVQGDIDYSCSTELRQLIAAELDKAPDRLVIDLAGVSYMDSSGVATLVEALQTQTKAKRKLILCNLQDRVKGIFEIARLTMVFTIVEDEAAAKTA